MKRVFHSFKKPLSDGIFKLEEGAKKSLTSLYEGAKYSHKYPRLAEYPFNDDTFCVRGFDEQDTVYVDFPRQTDYLIIGGGLVGSAISYYLKSTVTRGISVTVVDAHPDSARTSSFQASNSVRLQNLNYRSTRLAALTMALIRDLKNEVLVTDQEYKNLNLRPCSHMILWPESQIETVMRAYDMQQANGCHVDLLHGTELSSMFPFINYNNDFSLATIGQQVEGLVDPVPLRNLYRTLGSAYGCDYFVGEVIDFNVRDHIEPEKDILRCNAAIVRLPSGELRHLGFGTVILANGYNIGDLEYKTSVNEEMRGKFKDLTCVKPRVKLNYLFHSDDAPLLRMPVIVDVDGTTIMRRGIGGNFHCVLGPEHHTILDIGITPEADLESRGVARLVEDDERVDLEKKFQSKLSNEYFLSKVKPALIRRVTAFKDARLVNSWISIDDYNSYDGCPFFGYHPYYPNVMLACGLADKNTQLAPAVGRILADQALGFEQEGEYDCDGMYRWNRVMVDEKMHELAY